MAEGEAPIKFGSYARGRELGRGASGTVFICESSTRVGERYAAKAIDLRRLRLSARADRELKKLQREVDILKRVPPHRHLVRFIDALEDGNWFFLVLEFVGGGDLFSALLRRPSGPFKRPCFSEAETVFVLRQLVDGLELLHGHGVIHRDLKLENILVAKETADGADVLCDVKITDFGLSKIVGDGFSVAHSTVGSPRYIAPEVMARGVHDFRADLWSLGVLLYVLLAGRFPVDSTPEVRQADLDVAVAGLGASAPARAVVAGLLRVDRDQRLSLQHLRAQPWLRSGRGCGAQPPGPAPKKARVDLEPTSTTSLFGSEDCAPGRAGPGISPGAGAGQHGENEVAEMDETHVLPIQELDSQGEGRAVRGTVAFRRDHKSGGGFHLRLGDATGEIDIRFWDEAAQRFREDPALQKGAVLRIGGFRFAALKAKDMPFAPPGRLHHLNFNAARDVRFCLEEPAAS